MKDFPTQAIDYDIEEPKADFNIISVPGPAWKDPVDTPVSIGWAEQDTMNALALVAFIVAFQVSVLIWRALRDRFELCRKLDEKAWFAPFASGMVWLCLIRTFAGIFAPRLSRDTEQWVWIAIVSILVAWIQSLYRTIAMVYASMERSLGKERLKKAE